MDWEAGDFLLWDNWRTLWDNWRTMHQAYGHPKRYARVVHRTTLKSDMKLGRWLSPEESAAARQAAA